MSPVAHGHTSLSRLVTGLMLAAGLSILALGIGFRVADLHVQTVLSGSMRPTVSAGDLAITQAVPMGALRVGDVIAFTPPNETRQVLHRVESLQNTVITTKGDANSVADPWHLTLNGSIAHRMVAVLPFLGWLTELQRPAFLFAGLLLVLAILLDLRKKVRRRTAKTLPETQS